MQNIKTFFRMFHQLMAVLNKKQKRQALLIAILTIFSAMLEMLGVGVVLPFVFALLQPEKLMKVQLVKVLVEKLHLDGTNDIIILSALGIIVIYVLKNGFILFSSYIQLNFRNKLERDLSILMLKSYIYKPYYFFLNVNSAEIMRGITGDISGVATTVDCFSGLLNEGLTCLLLGGLLITINPMIAMGLMGLVIVIALLMVIGLRKRIAKCGERCRYAFAKRQQHAYQAINGIKEIQVVKRQKNFLKYFTNASNIACTYNTQYLWIARVPSRVIETLFIAGLILIILVNIQNVGNVSILVAQMSAIAVAAVRILPSISNIANSMNTLVYQRLALENAYQNITNIDLSDEENSKLCVEKNNNDYDFKEKICIKGISWKYSPELPNVLENLSMEIKPGESIGLIGESGAGKTTLADILLGLFKPQSGDVLVDGKSIYDVNTEWHKLIGYVPQSVYLIDDTVRNNILFGVDERDIDEEKIWAALEQAQLKEFVKKLPYGLDTVLGERGVKISGGQRQRISIARALYYNPDILVLDEATSALDNETENAIMDSINQLQGQKTLIIVAHRLTTIEKCDRVFEIKNKTAQLVRF